MKYAGEKDSRRYALVRNIAAGIVVFMTDADFKFTFPDGKTENIQGKARQFLWFAEPWERLPENLSNKPYEAIYVDLKR